MNTIGVFNSFPIIWVTTQGGPANSTDILVTYLYKLGFNFGKLGEASALSLMMFALLLFFTVIYVRLAMRENGHEGLAQAQAVYPLVAGAVAAGGRGAVPVRRDVHHRHQAGDRSAAADLVAERTAMAELRHHVAGHHSRRGAVELGLRGGALDPALAGRPRSRPPMR